MVLPARDNQLELERTLAALAHQTYPSELLEVVVVDDASGTPLQVPPGAPPGTRVVRRDEAQSHGSGAARHEGALATQAPILLFLDSDMLADPAHVEAHARWHHVCDHALVLGRKWFVKVDDLGPAEIERAGRDGTGVGDLLTGRAWRTHQWQEEHIEQQDGLTRDADDVFIAVVGATVSIRRELYRRTGGFATFGLRGIVDTEFGYRAYTRGALVVPDSEARCWHQGARNFATRGAEIKRTRMGLAANYLPVPLFRPHNRGRRWTVPTARVVVDVSGQGPGQLGEDAGELLLLTVDSVLGSEMSDLAITVVTGQTQLPSWWSDYVASEHRVESSVQALTSGFPSPLTVVVPVGVVLAADSLTRAVALLGEEVRVVRTLPNAYGTPSVEVWRTRTWRGRCAWAWTPWRRRCWASDGVPPRPWACVPGPRASLPRG
ncbi:hypothetical protein BJF80_00110 [Serinicoccus sp. CUA-874]|nr:hypothetical protein BJF80_00110 [Serinicoccus sp. CUA-874]